MGITGTPQFPECNPWKNNHQYVWFHQDAGDEFQTRSHVSRTMSVKKFCCRLRGPTLVARGSQLRNLWQVFFRYFSVYHVLEELFSKSSRVGEGKKSAFDCATSMRLLPPNSSQIFAHSNGECLLGTLESNPSADPNTFLRIFHGPDDNPRKFDIVLNVFIRVHRCSSTFLWYYNCRCQSRVWPICHQNQNQIENDLCLCSPAHRLRDRGERGVP